jgi:hypothetical protein
MYIYINTYIYIVLIYIYILYRSSGGMPYEEEDACMTGASAGRLAGVITVSLGFQRA